MIGSECLCPRRFHEWFRISTRQYTRIVRDWVASIGLETSVYGTHSMRQTKVTQIYKKIGNLWAVQMVLGQIKIWTALSDTLASSLKIRWRSLKLSNLYDRAVVTDGP